MYLGEETGIVVKETTSLEKKRELTENKLINNLDSIGGDELLVVLKDLGVNEDIIDKLKLNLQKEFILNSFFTKDTKTLCITIKACGNKLNKGILLKRTEYYSINPKTREKNLKYTFRIV